MSSFDKELSHNVYYVFYNDIKIILFNIRYLSVLIEIKYSDDFEDHSVMRRPHMRRQSLA
jgi:hypothetical protein